MLSKAPIGHFGLMKPHFLTKIAPNMRPPMNFLTKQGPIGMRKPIIGPVISEGPVVSQIQRG